MMSTLQEFTNYGIWVCDIVALVLLTNYLFQCCREPTERHNPAMAFAFLFYIGGHTIGRTWVIVTHEPILYSHWIDVTSAVVATIGLMACIRAFSVGSSLWVWIMIGATVLAATLTVLL